MNNNNIAYHVIEFDKITNHQHNNIDNHYNYKKLIELANHQYTCAVIAHIPDTTWYLNNQVQTNTKYTFGRNQYQPWGKPKLDPEQHAKLHTHTTK